VPFERAPFPVTAPPAPRGSGVYCKNPDCVLFFSSSSSLIPHERIPYPSSLIPHERIRSQPFFDAECRKLKREVWHLGRRVGWRGEVFKALERKYHALVRRKRRSYQFQRACQTLEHMKSQPKKFWASFQDAPERLPQALRNVRAWDSFVQSLAGSPGMVSSLANPSP
jgi:hypothetical protein